MVPSEGKRPPGRPRNLPVEEQRRVILEGAREVFAIHGFRGATIERVARTAGVARPAVYEHFGGKEELWVAVVDDAVERVFEWTGARIDLAIDRSLRSMVRLTVSSLFEFIEAHPHEAAIIRLVEQTGTDSAHVEVVAGRQRIEAALTFLMENGWAPYGGIPKEAARVLAVSCISMVEAVGFRQVAEPGWSSAATIDLLTELLIGGFQRLATDRRTVDAF